MSVIDRATTLRRLAGRYIGDYVAFASQNRALVQFGFLSAALSSFGQTYFIGVFGPALRSEFELSHTLWGLVYMIGTLASAAVLPFTGRYIDTLPLRRYALVVMVLLIVACLFTSLTDNIWMLVAAIFLLRQSGQGLMSHVAITSMARYFDAYRGRAIAIASLGFAAGEAVLPWLAVIGIGVFGWRISYASAAVVVFVVATPMIYRLLKGHDETHRRFVEQQRAISSVSGDTSYTLGEVLKDKRFYLILPAVTAPSIIMTAMFFHHLNLADSKGWSHEWITGNYIVYAIVVVLTSLVTGPLVDRFGALRIVSTMLAPLVAALFSIAVFDSAYIVWLYFLLAGVHVGIAHTAVSAMWAEVYGVTHLGAIKSLAASVSVFASALGPVIVGGLMDFGVSIESTCLLFAAYSLVGAVSLSFCRRRAF